MRNNTLLHSDTFPQVFEWEIVWTQCSVQGSSQHSIHTMALGKWSSWRETGVEQHCGLEWTNQDCGMPTGLCNAPGTFQKECLFSSPILNGKSLWCIFEDILLWLGAPGRAKIHLCRVFLSLLLKTAVMLSQKMICYSPIVLAALNTWYAHSSLRLRDLCSTIDTIFIFTKTLGALDDKSWNREMGKGKE